MPRCRMVSRKTRRKMALLDLPLELLTPIIGFVDPLDVENFAASCKKLRDCSKSRLASHYRMKKAHFYLDVKEFASVLALLDWLFHHPEEANYVRILDIAFTHDTRDPNFSQVRREMLQSLLVSTKHLQPTSWPLPTNTLPRSAPSPHERYRRVMETADALAPLLCPNVETLVRSTAFPERHNALAESFMHKTAQGKGGFAHLTGVVIHSERETSPDDEIDIAALSTYLAMPKVTKLTGVRVRNIRGALGRLEAVANSSNVEILELQRSVMGPQDMRILSDCFKHLKGFHYSLSRSRGLLAPVPSQLNVVKELQVKHGNTLRSLSLLLPCEDRGDQSTRRYGVDVPVGIDHFRDFSVLEELQLNTYWIWPLLVTEDGSNTDNRTGFEVDNKISGRLPTSLTYLGIQSWKVTSDIDDEDLVATAKSLAEHVGILSSLFQGFEHDFRKRLPNLKELQLEDAPESFASGIRRELKSVEIKGLKVSIESPLRHQVDWLNPA